MPHRNTSGNSRPLALCRVIICTQSSMRLALGLARFQHRVRQEALQRRQLAVGLIAARGADQLLQVLDPRLAAIGLVLLMMLDQAAGLDDVIDLLVQRQARDASAASCSISCRKAATAAPERPASAGGDRCASGAPQRAAGGAGGFADAIERARADAARRQVDDALERGVIIAIGDQPQVRERILDLGALEEAQAAVHPVRHARHDQRFLEAA